MKTKYSEIDKQIKKKCRKDKQTWLQDKCEEAQKAADKNDSKSLYRIITDLTGKRGSQSIPIKDKKGKTLLSQKEQDNRWIEHFKEILNQPEPTGKIDLNAFPQMNEINANLGRITEDEVTGAIPLLRVLKIL